MIQTRKLLGYFDASELSLVTGKTHRPVTILVFTDKIMVVKRKNYNLQSKDYLENIEERVKVGSSNTILQKAKEVYNGLPLEFKGWADIHTVEVFNGLKGSSSNTVHVMGDTTITKQKNHGPNLFII